MDYVPFRAADLAVGDQRGAFAFGVHGCTQFCRGRGVVSGALTESLCLMTKNLVDCILQRRTQRTTHSCEDVLCLLELLNTTTMA